MIKDKNDKTKLQTDPIQIYSIATVYNISAQQLRFLQNRVLFFTHCSHCTIYKYSIIFYIITTIPTQYKRNMEFTIACEWFLVAN